MFVDRDAPWGSVARPSRQSWTAAPALALKWPSAFPSRSAHLPKVGSISSCNTTCAKQNSVDASYGYESSLPRW